MNWNENIKAAIKAEVASNELGNKAFGVKIVLHHAECHSAIRDTVYYNKGFRFQHFSRWKWYFRYRAALVQVQNPRWCVEVVFFDYEKTPTDTEIEKRRKDIIAARRRNVTIAKEKLAQYEKKYKGLFPITEDPQYIAALESVKNYEIRLNKAEAADFVPKII
jgi:hypothetical protein